FKPDRTVLKSSELITEVFIDHACKNYLLRNIRILFSEFKKINACAHFCTREHFLYDRRISTDRDSLISVIEIVVVINKAAWESLNDKCRKLSTLSAPLLLSITLDQLL